MVSFNFGSYRTLPPLNPSFLGYSLLWSGSYFAHPNISLLPTYSKWIMRSYSVEYVSSSWVMAQSTGGLYEFIK